MKDHRNYLVAAGLLALMLALPGRTGGVPAQTRQFQFKGLIATALFDSFDVTGCVETVAGVEGITGASTCRVVVRRPLRLPWCSSFSSITAAKPSCWT